MKTIAFLMTVLAAGVAGAAAPPAIDFATGKPAAYFTEPTAGRVQVSSVKQVQTMVISDSTARLRDVTVEPGVKYTLKLKAAFEGDVESMEENPRFEIFARLGQTSVHLPSRRIEFLDAAIHIVHGTLLRLADVGFCDVGHRSVEVVERLPEVPGGPLRFTQFNFPVELGELVVRPLDVADRFIPLPVLVSLFPAHSVSLLHEC